MRVAGEEKVQSAFRLPLLVLPAFFSSIHTCYLYLCISPGGGALEVGDADDRFSSSYGSSFLFVVD